jgi:hypothetical protein
VKTQDQVADIFTKPLKYDFLQRLEICWELWKMIRVDIEGECWSSISTKI